MFYLKSNKFYIFNDKFYIWQEIFVIQTAFHKPSVNRFQCIQILTWFATVCIDLTFIH